MNSPIASWIMIFLDGAMFIDEAIASVVASTDIDDWELILVDDGSTDESTAIARRWSETDPARIRYVEHPDHANQGMSASRNLGIQHARGELIGFLDCDDVLLPDTMARSAHVLERHDDADVVIGETLAWHSWRPAPNRNAKDDFVFAHPADLGRAATIARPDFFRSMYGEPGAWSVPCICGIVIRRSSLESIAGFDDSFRGMFEDQVFYAKIGLHLSVVLDDRTFALYRQHDESECARDGRVDHWNPWKRNPPRDRFLAWLEEYLRSLERTSTEEWDIVQQNIGHRESVRNGTERLLWTSRRVIMERLPAPIASTLRRARAAVVVGDHDTGGNDS